MANILVIDDGIDILSILKIGLEKDGHRVDTINDPSVVTLEKIKYYDLILLDIMMPKIDGYDVIKKYRELTNSPIIFLTAKVAEKDILYGLSLGADDYLLKPFKITELRARVKAHLRRESREITATLHIENFRFDLAGKKLFFNDSLVPLTKGEYDICEFLARNRGRVYGKDDIYESVFGYDAVGDSRSVGTHIKNIRGKFAKYQTSPIDTHWGVGYLWK